MTTNLDGPITGQARQHKILVVDDDRNLAYAVAGILHAEGFEVAVAFNGASALALDEQLHPDIVILDIMMPKMDGFEVCHQFKEMRQEGQPKVIIVSGVATGVKLDVPNLLNRSGADAFLPKPCLADTLLAEIRRLLPTSSQPVVAQRPETRPKP